MSPPVVIKTIEHKRNTATLTFEPPITSALHEAGCFNIQCYNSVYLLYSSESRLITGMIRAIDVSFYGDIIHSGKSYIMFGGARLEATNNYGAQPMTSLSVPLHCTSTNLHDAPVDNRSVRYSISWRRAPCSSAPYPRSGRPSRCPKSIMTIWSRRRTSLRLQ
jgi:hypothetical protein